MKRLAARARAPTAAVTAALRGGETVDVAAVWVDSTSYFVAGSNATFSFANQISLLDLDEDAFNVDNCRPGTGICVPIEQHLLTLADGSDRPLVQVVTAPGELFPELFYGTQRNHRTDCPQAHTGEPFEPSIRDAMTATYRFLIGLSPDEFGLHRPGYEITRALRDVGAARLRAALLPALSAGPAPLRYHAALDLAALAHEGGTWSRSERAQVERLANDPALDPALRPLLAEILRVSGG